MSLTTDDLQDIRTIIKDEINPLRGDIEALSNDIKEIYEMISELQSSTITDKSFKKKSLEDKLLTVNAELLAMARQAGITLPR